MSKSAVLEAVRPAESVAETAMTDMSQFERILDTPEPAPTAEPAPSTPGKDQAAISDRGLPKNGIPLPPEKQPETKISDLASKAGSIYHGEARAALSELDEVKDEGSIAIRGLSTVVRNLRRKVLHDRSPALYRGWARKSSEMMPELFEALLPETGKSARLVAEPRLLVGAKYRQAAARLKGVLEEEQRNGDGTPGPFERLMLAAPSFQLQGKRTGKFARLLREMPDSVPLSRNAVRRLTRQARTHMFIKGGNIIAPPTSCPDIVQFVYDDDDSGARQASEALSNVLKMNIGFDPDRLHREAVTYTDRDETTGQELEMPLTALEAVHWAVSLIGNGRITPCILDIKLQPHVGKKWEALNPLWKEKSHDLKKIFSTQNLQSEDPKYMDLQNHWNKMERDVAATAYSFLGWLRMAEREFRNRNAREREPIVKWDVLAKRIRAAIILVDFDISKPGEPLEHTAEELPLGYQTSPPLEQAGVPKDVSTMLRPVEPYRLQKRLFGREREMRRQYIKHHIAKTAIDQVKSQAA